MTELDQLQRDILNAVVLLNPQGGRYADRYVKRAKEGRLTRDENPQSHTCVYFLPYNSKTKQVFMIHHKKSGLWLSPGGHVDKGEDLLQALNREIEEELGIVTFFKKVVTPFLLTITPIENMVQPCKEHFDIWFLMKTDGSDFNVDPKEFHSAKWSTIPEAKVIVTDPANLNALDLVEKGV